MKRVFINWIKMSTDQKKANLAKLLATKSRIRPVTATISSQTDTAQADPSSTVSRYFSPRRTRNQIKIKYESDAPAAPQTLSKGANKIKPGGIKLEPVDLDIKQDFQSLNKRSIKIKTDDVKLEPVVLQIKQEPQSSTKRPAKIISSEVKLEPVHSKIKQEPRQSSNKRESSNKNSDESSPSKQPKWEPADWRRTLDDIRTMRAQKMAAVDTMGCHKCADPNADEKTQRFQNLVALMLSSQTKDEVTFQAMKRLKNAGLTPSSVVDMNTEALQQLIYPVSFYKNKTKYLQQTARILIDQYDSDIPPTYPQMIKLPGIGPKMAHICMYVAWHVVSGIGVDTHVHRITNRLRWSQRPTADPERTRAALEEWLPMNLWPEVNALLVGFGQTICTPTYPKCSECLLADRCPSRGVKS